VHTGDPGFWLTQPALRSSCRRKAAELQRPALIPVKLERELLEPRSHRIPEAPRVGFMLEADHDVVGVAHDDHVGFALHPGRIRDEGPGIPEPMLERVFDPFFRLEGSRSRDTGGTGLGLSIARNIARAAGGDVSLRNVPSGGLEALLVLPR